MFVFSFLKHKEIICSTYLIYADHVVACGTVSKQLSAIIYG